MGGEFAEKSVIKMSNMYKFMDMNFYNTALNWYKFLSSGGIMVEYQVCPSFLYMCILASINETINCHL